MRSVSRQELALEQYKLWDPGQTLRVRFLDGDRRCGKIVEDLARQWLEYANLKFEFGNYPDAVIRITFQPSGRLLVIGWQRLASRISESRADDGDWAGWKGRTVRPAGTARRRPRVRPRYRLHPRAGQPVWQHPVEHSQALLLLLDALLHGVGTVDTNILKRYSLAGTDAAHNPDRVAVATDQHDPKSIMQYPVPKELTIDGSEIGWNTEVLRDGQALHRDDVSEVGLPTTLAHLSRPGLPASPPHLRN